MTYQRVLECIQQLEAEGKEPSSRAITNRIGGSRRDILRLLRTIRGGAAPPVLNHVQRIPSSQPECSLEARMLAERLAQVAVQDTILYSTLCSLVNLDVQDKRRDLLDTARNLVQKEYGRVFGAVTGIGLKRLDDLGIVSTGEQTRQRMFRMTRRTIGKLTCVNVDALTPADQHRLWTYQGLLGAVGVLMHPKTLTHARTMEQPQQLAWDGESVKQLFVVPKSAHQQGA